MLKEKRISEQYVLMVAGITFLIYAAYRVLLIQFPHPDVGGVENNVIWFIQRMLDGGHLYSDPERSPYSISQYTPLYYYLCTAVARMFHFGPEDILKLFGVSRGVSLLLNFLFAFIVYRSASTLRATRTASIIAGISAFIFLEITSFSRPDSLEHVFSLLSFYLLLRLLMRDPSNQRPVNSLVLLSGMTASLAVFSKQSAIAVAIGIIVWLISKKRFGQLGSWLASFAVTSCLILLLIHQESGLKFFAANTVGGVSNGISLYWFIKTIVKDFYGHAGLIFIPAFITILFLTARNKSDAVSFIRTLLVTSFLFANLFALKWGSSPGYFTTFMALIVIGCAAFIKKPSELPDQLYTSIINLSIIFIFVVKIGFVFYPLRDLVGSSKRAAGNRQFETEMQIALAIKQRLKSTPEHKVFNNIYSPEFYLNNLLFREAVIPQFEVVVFGTWDHSSINYDHFRNDIRTGNIQYLVRKSDTPLQFMDINLGMFQFRDSLPNGYLLYEFKQ